MTTHTRISERLRWQSRFLVVAVAPLSAAMAAACAARAGAAATWAALSISLAIAAGAWLARAATPPAALTGGILTAAMLLPSVRPGVKPGAVLWLHSPLAPLMTLLVLTLAATKYGGRQKESLGVGQDRHGRTAAQVVANLGVAALAAAIPPASLFFSSPVRNTPAVLSFLLGGGSSVILVAALAEATADTLSSELGEVWGGRPFLITRRFGSRRVPAGTDGAISAPGTLAGAIGAALVVLAAIPTVGLDRTAAVAAAVGAMGGLFFDSLLGATLEQRGRLNNDAVNFLSTLAAALLSFAVYRSGGAGLF